jgi:hypothetical protein
MSERITETTSALKQVADDAQSTFGSLSASQLNWKPDDKSWSVAQCFDHLIATHSLYFPLFGRLAGGSSQSLWERISPLSGFFGRFLIKGLDPKNLKKMKTTSKAFPSSSEISGDIIKRFCEHQDQIIASLKKLESIDAKKTVITSPLLALVTYSLDDTFTILAFHCQRHFDQAKRVMESFESDGRV